MDKITYTQKIYVTKDEKDKIKQNLIDMRKICLKHNKKCYLSQVLKEFFLNKINDEEFLKDLKII